MYKKTKVKVHNKNTNEDLVFDSLFEACKHLGMSYDYAGQVRNKLTWHEFEFEFLDEKVERKMPVKVKAVCNETGETLIFESRGDARRYFGLKSSSSVPFIKTHKITFIRNE